MEHPCVHAVQHLRQMSGETKSHLFRCSDGKFYVTKLQWNPQGTRVLANEWLASELAQAVGLRVPAIAAVCLSPFLIKSTPELSSYPPGVHFGSQYLAAAGGPIWDLMPEPLFGRVTNIGAFYGALAFDKWTSNMDGRQAVFCPTTRGHFRACFIDHARCFCASEWTFSDVPGCGLYHPLAVYAGIAGWNSFEPVLSNIESLSEEVVWRIVADIPSEWIDDHARLEALVVELLKRRNRLRAIIQELRSTMPAIFPNWWTEKTRCARSA